MKFKQALKIISKYIKQIKTMEKTIVFQFEDEKEVVKRDFTISEFLALSSQGAVIAHNEKEYILDKKVIDVDSCTLNLYLKLIISNN